MPIFAEGRGRGVLYNQSRLFSAVKKFKGKVQLINIGQTVEKALITFSSSFFSLVFMLMFFLNTCHFFPVQCVMQSDGNSLILDTF